LYHIILYYNYNHINYGFIIGLVKTTVSYNVQNSASRVYCAFNQTMH